ncbi:glycerate kinase [Thermophilibacter provencensis]|uniref:Glycerate kinase n=1 Tax=Thermophilibacter provencensis TaxID=1852386 RepID=A0ABT7V4U5_9ACTN|nr:glycerate kinase [Thermophilibacter provencensis]MDM8271621.1 glycerate kinase [Thermophilibacter provencensis]
MSGLPKFVFASDSLKGTLSSAATARLLTAAARRHFSGCACLSVPMADGGDGTAAALAQACGGELRRVRAADPLGRPVDAAYAMLPDGRAVIEMAAASGLPLLAPGEKNPLLTTTYGTGELIRAALGAGARDVTLALGGSATNDGGMGCMRALGARFLTADGNELAGCGADLARVASIDVSGLDPRVREAGFRLMCDVDNPLVGPEGASAVYGPQKGATPEKVAELDAGMASYARVLAATFGRNFADVPGAGAAGGMGAAAMAFLGARARSGIACVLELTNFSALLEGADLCVTGEGHADAQTSRGKVVDGVAAACAAAGVPCVAVVGGMSADAARLPGLAAVVPTAIDAMPLEEALARAEELYALAAERLFSLLALGARL